MLCIYRQTVNELWFYPYNITEQKMWKYLVEAGYAVASSCCFTYFWQYALGLMHLWMIRVAADLYLIAG